MSSGQSSLKGVSTSLRCPKELHYQEGFVHCLKQAKKSPGIWPMGVLDLPLPPSVVLLCSQTAQSRGAPGVSAGKVRGTRSPRPPVNLRQGHGDLLFARDSVDAFRKHI